VPAGPGTDGPVAGQLTPVRKRWYSKQLAVVPYHIWPEAVGDPSASAGGEVGWIARKDTVVDEAFARAAFALKVGDVSEPVDTDYGVHLIRVLERKAGTPQPFAEVKDEVRDGYAEDVRQNLVRQLRKTGVVQVTVP
jgi:parvulin-like peptidyl-prolyl isomerase